MVLNHYIEWSKMHFKMEFCLFWWNTYLNRSDCGGFCKHLIKPHLLCCWHHVGGGIWPGAPPPVLKKSSKGTCCMYGLILWELAHFWKTHYRQKNTSKVPKKDSFKQILKLNQIKKF